MKLHTLQADSSSDLDWDLSSKEGVWHLDFGWDKRPLNPFNPAHFNACLLATIEFSKKIEGPQEVVLLISDGEFQNLLSVDEDPLFCAQLMSEYLHRLAYPLPDDVIPTLLLSIDAAQDFAELVIRLCRRRFEHFQLRFTDTQIPIEGEAKIGVSLPSDERYDSALFNTYFRQLPPKEFICIPEEFLNEHWDGLDHILYDPELISDTGKRMLLGFEAAGGKALCLNQWLK